MVLLNRQPTLHKPSIMAHKVNFCWDHPLLHHFLQENRMYLVCWGRVVFGMLGEGYICYVGGGVKAKSPPVTEV